MGGKRLAVQIVEPLGYGHMGEIRSGCLNRAMAMACSHGAKRRGIMVDVLW